MVSDYQNVLTDFPNAWSSNLNQRWRMNKKSLNVYWKCYPLFCIITHPIGKPFSSLFLDTFWKLVGKDKISAHVLRHVFVRISPDSMSGLHNDPLNSQNWSHSWTIKMTWIISKDISKPQKLKDKWVRMEEGFCTFVSVPKIHLLVNNYFENGTPRSSTSALYCIYTNHGSACGGWRGFCK